MALPRRFAAALAAAALVPGLWLSSSPAAARGHDDVYLANVATKGCLDTPRARSGNGAVTAECRQVRAQRWAAEQVQGGLRLRSDAGRGDLCLTADPRGGDRRTVRLRTCDGRAEQRFLVWIVDDTYVVLESAVHRGRCLGVDDSGRVALLRAAPRSGEQQWAFFRMSEESA
ncbi:hypothetical protein GCM10027168_52130 [Streptomyces capparidis]